MAAHGNRTVLCSVVFIDIVEYSKKSVEEQMQIKQHFNALLLAALASVPADDRIILDTGDGAAINFLGDPEECLFVALALRNALAAQALRLRIGINLGPVRLVKDINGQPNIIGDGINVAQRIMSFADVDQILVSRSFYELISALSSDYAHLFAFEGARTDKHVREHEVYALGKSPVPQRAPRKPMQREATRAQAAWRRVEFAVASAQAHVMRRPPFATALTVGAILLMAVMLRLTLRDADSGAATDLVAQPAVGVATPAPERSPPPPPPPVEPERRPLPPQPVVETPPPPPPPQARPESGPGPEVRAREPVAPAATGIVRMTIIPWGEVYVDGRKLGVAPPLRDVPLNVGPHRIEIRNPGFPSHVQVVDVRAREEIRIRHRFQ